ncbi:MAG: hypothetical protein NW241_19570 [Bacteroidia bacterium]|nr:hypothetical protein [Bacteroidia bacterium]
MRFRIPRFWLLLPVAALLLCGPALYNGYPLVYADTGTYLSSGMRWQAPEDRPLMYGGWIRVLSLHGATLWPVIWAQGLIMAWLLLRFLRGALDAQLAERWALPLTGLLALATGAGWYTSQLMPDWLLPAGVLAWLCLRLDPDWRRAAAPALVLALAAGAHLSHGLILAGILLADWLAAAWAARRWAPARAHGIGFSALAIGLAAALSLNAAAGGGWRLARWGHVVLLGRMLDAGMLKPFLDERCPEAGYALCGYRDALPGSSREFIWDPERSPALRAGGWQAVRQDYLHVLGDALRSPRYLLWMAGEALRSTASQLLQNPLGEGLETDWYGSPGSPPWEAIRRYVPHEHPVFLNARQQTDIWNQRLNLGWLQTLHSLLLAASAGWLCYQLGAGRLRQLPPARRRILAGLLAALLANAAVTATLANVYGRLQGRVSWLLILAALLTAAWMYAEPGKNRPDLSRTPPE